MPNIGKSSQSRP